MVGFGFCVSNILLMVFRAFSGSGFLVWSCWFSLQVGFWWVADGGFGFCLLFWALVLLVWLFPANSWWRLGAFFVLVEGSGLVGFQCLNLVINVTKRSPKITNTSHC